MSRAKWVSLRSPPRRDRRPAREAAIVQIVGREAGIAGCATPAPRLAEDSSARRRRHGRGTSDLASSQNSSTRRDRGLGDPRQSWRNKARSNCVPQMPPAVRGPTTEHSSTLSVSNWRMARQRLCTQCWRGWPSLAPVIKPRASSRFATFAQAISNTQPNCAEQHEQHNRDRRHKALEKWNRRRPEF